MEILSLIQSSIQRTSQPTTRDKRNPSGGSQKGGTGDSNTAMEKLFFGAAYSAHHNPPQGTSASKQQSHVGHKQGTSQISGIHKV